MSVNVKTFSINELKSSVNTQHHSVMQNVSYNSRRSRLCTTLETGIEARVSTLPTAKLDWSLIKRSTYNWHLVFLTVGNFSLNVYFTLFKHHYQLRNLIYFKVIRVKQDRLKYVNLKCDFVVVITLSQTNDNIIYPVTLQKCRQQ